MSVSRLLWIILGTQIATVAFGVTSQPMDPAAAFGARPSVSMMSLSADGASIAYVAPGAGEGSTLYTMRLGEHAREVPALVADGKPWRMHHCDWVADTRLACVVYAIQRTAATGMELVTLSRLIAVTENYPQLKSDQNFRDLQAQLEGTENRITVARNRYIQAVQDYNTLIRQFPTNLTAMMFKYPVKQNFTVQNETEISHPPTVDFGGNSAPAH